MGRNLRGIHRDASGAWCVDKWFKGQRLLCRFGDREEAESWLIKKLGDLRTIHLFGERPKRTFEVAATMYLEIYKARPSIVSDSYLLPGLMPYIGALPLEQVHDGTLAPFVDARRKEGRAHKTINRALALTRRILNLAATSWRDENGLTWIQSAPAITMLPLVGFQREPRPITWSEQRALFDRLPRHLERMATFMANTGVRDDVVCSLRWQWEIPVPDLGVSVFEVPREHVKGRRRPRVVVCNKVAQAVIESVRGQHPEFVFVYSRPAGKTGSGCYEPHPMETMHNSAWQRARREVGLDGVRVHDLRHTTGMRLREAGVHEATIRDILWHSTGSITLHYSVAQIVELFEALQKIEQDTGRWNKSLSTLRREHQMRASLLVRDESPAKVPQQRKTA